MRTRKKHKILITGWLKGHQQDPEMKPKIYAWRTAARIIPARAPAFLKSPPGLSVISECSVLLAALTFHIRRRYRISTHKTQVCQNSTLSSIYDLTFYLKLSISSFGRNFNQTHFWVKSIKSGFSCLNPYL